MFNHWYTWVLIIAIIVIIRYRKKLSAILDAQEKASPAGTKTPLDNLIAKAESSMNAQDLVNKVVEAAQAEYNKDLFDNGPTEASIKESDFLNMIVAEHDKILVPPPENTLGEGGKIRRDLLWYPEIMHKLNPDWNKKIERVVNGDPYELTPCGCGCGKLEITLK